MLEPQDRRLLLDALHPPPDHRLDGALATTYSLDLAALLTVPLAFAFDEWEDDDGRPLRDPLALLQAVRKHAGHLCVFCQAGQIHVPGKYQRLFAAFEESVVQAQAPRGGRFHPKLWVLRFVARDQSVLYRVLCASRNLTFDRSWDTLLRLEGPLVRRANAFARNHPLGDFVAALPGMAPTLSPAWRERIGQMATELRRVEFELPEPFTELAFWPLGHGSKSRRPFPNGLTRWLVVSPFVDDAFLATLAADSAGQPTGRQLVSRLESLERLAPETGVQFERLWVLDDGAEDATDDTDDDDSPSHDERPTDTSPLAGLHAKLFVAEKGATAQMWTGSANATTAAFEKNVEFLVELRGPKTKCGIDAVLGADDARTSAGPVSLLQLLRPFVPGRDGAADAARDAFDRAVERLAQRLASAGPLARCFANETGFAVELAGDAPMDADAAAGLDGATLSVWPISIADTGAQPCLPAETPWARFAALSLEALTPFFAFEVRSGDSRFRRRFVLCVTLADAPENRRELLVQSLLDNPRDVLRLLLMLLEDRPALAAWAGDGNSAAGDTRGAGGLLRSPALCDSLLRALDRTPDKLDDIARIVDDLRRTPNGAALLPAQFDEIWEPIRTVHRRRTERHAKARKRRGGES